MLFYVCCSLIWDDELNDYSDKLPYEEFKKAKGIRINRKYTDSPEKIPYYNGDKELADKEWYGLGRNHRVVNGMIERDFDDEFYIIEINTIEELLEFQKKYNINATVSPNKNNYVYNGIELYTFYEDYHME